MGSITVRGVNKEEQIAWFILQERVKYSDSKRRQAIRVLKQMLYRLEEEYNSDLDETKRVCYSTGE